MDPQQDALRKLSSWTIRKQHCSVRQIRALRKLSCCDERLASRSDCKPDLSRIHLSGIESESCTKFFPRSSFSSSLQARRGEQQHQATRKLGKGSNRELLHELSRAMTTHPPGKKEIHSTKALDSRELLNQETPESSDIYPPGNSTRAWELRLVFVAIIRVSATARCWTPI